MDKYETVHPGEEHLLLYADGELQSGEASRIRLHLEACWRCRSELEDLQQTIADYVAYRQNALPVPDPPQPWNRFHTRLDHLIEQQRPQLPWWNGILRIRTLAVLGAACAAVLFFAIFQPGRIRTVSAAELLSRASIRENQAPHPGSIRITTAAGTFTRAAIRHAGYRDKTDRELQTLFQNAEYSWDNPLSAVSYAAWRDRMTDRSDDVTMVQGNGAAVYRLRTTTQSGGLREVNLRIRANDYDVIGGSFHFSDNQWVEMEALPPEPAPVASQSVPAPMAAPEILPKAKPEADGVDDPAQELRLMAALRKSDADLGEQIEISREGRHVVVTATGLGLDRQEAVRRSLDGLGVTLRFRDPEARRGAPPTSQGPPPSPLRAPFGTDEATPTQMALARALGGASALERFSNQVLELSQAGMARAYALRHLADRFPVGVEAGFGADDRAVLVQLQRDHWQALDRTVHEIDRLLRPVLASLGAEVPVATAAPSSASWQESSRDLLNTARRLDDTITQLLTGSGTRPAADLIADTARALRDVENELARSAIGDHR